MKSEHALHVILRENMDCNVLTRVLDVSLRRRCPAVPIQQWAGVVAHSHTGGLPFLRVIFIPLTGEEDRGGGEISVHHVVPQIAYKVPDRQLGELRGHSLIIQICNWCSGVVLPDEIASVVDKRFRCCYKVVQKPADFLLCLREFLSPIYMP